MGDDPFMRSQNAAVQGRGKAQNRANVLQLKMIGQNHPTGLTSNLLKLFEPRPPLEYKPPPEKRKCPPYTGVAYLVSHFAEPNDPEYAPPVPKAETPAEKKARIHQLRLEKGAEKVAEEIAKYDPNSDPNIAGDPYKTLFVAKLSYETTESRLKREFESYGPIKRVGTHKKPRYGFGKATMHRVELSIWFAKKHLLAVNFKTHPIVLLLNILFFVIFFSVGVLNVVFVFSLLLFYKFLKSVFYLMPYFKFVFLAED